MKIAIHERKGSFSDRWIPYCESHGIPFMQVDCYDSDIVSRLAGCDGLMWHWNHEDYREQNFARQLIFSLEKMGKKVFPNFDSCWHFDDKVGQKYLLEAVGADLVPTTVLYGRTEALAWIGKAEFPKVFKLRAGAGSANVKLVRDSREARKLVKQAFGRGFPPVDWRSGLRQRFWILKRDRNAKALVHLAKGVARIALPRKDLALLPVQKGYIYFQDFIPGNSYDDRVVVIGERAIAIRRNNREGDFRASGSGLIEYGRELFDPKVISLAFEVAKKIGTQSLAFDFLYDAGGHPKITEISYCYTQGIAYDTCPGYWDRELNWHEAQVNPQQFIMEDFIRYIEKACLNG